MKIGLFWDNAINIKSYYVKDGTAYDFENNKPYTYHHTISAQCFPSTHNITFLWGNGVFLNLFEYISKGQELPDLDLDIIFYANERQGLDEHNWDSYSVECMRKKYPNTTIVGWIKEVYASTNGVNREANRIQFFKDCDYVHTEATNYMKTLPEFLNIEKLVGKKIQFTNQPLNIDYLYDNFYSNDKIKGIFAYIPNVDERHGKTYEFAKYIGEKYDLPVFYKTQINSLELSQIDFMKLWSQYLFHFNLDPLSQHPGGQCCQVANLGCINIGGLNESHKILFPNTAGTDLEKLEKEIVELLNSPEKQFETIQYAFNKLNEVYSFKTVKTQLEKLYK